MYTEEIDYYNHRYNIISLNVGKLLFRLFSVFQITSLFLENLIQIMTEVYGVHFFFIIKHEQKSKWFYMVLVAYNFFIISIPLLPRCKGFKIRPNILKKNNTPYIKVFYANI